MRSCFYTPIKVLPTVSAVWGNNFEVIKFLVSMGADVNVKTEHGCTPLNMAIMSNRKIETKEGKAIIEYLYGITEMSQKEEGNAEH